MAYIYNGTMGACSKVEGYTMTIMESNNLVTMATTKRTIMDICPMGAFYDRAHHSDDSASEITHTRAMAKAAGKRIVKKTVRQQVKRDIDAMLVELV